MLPRSSSSMQDKTFRSADREIVGGGSLMASYSGQPENKITRSNLVDQLREYQIRSKHDWASMSFFSSTSNPSYSSLKDMKSGRTIEFERTADMEGEDDMGLNEVGAGRWSISRSGENGHSESFTPRIRVKLLFSRLIMMRQPKREGLNMTRKPKDGKWSKWSWQYYRLKDGSAMNSIKGGSKEPSRFVFLIGIVNRWFEMRISGTNHGLGFSGIRFQLELGLIRKVVPIAFMANSNGEPRTLANSIRVEMIQYEIRGSLSEFCNYDIVSIDGVDGGFNGNYEEA
ncbi:hypothetical protein E3N88_40286 [Mikania micrantha]|uniref:Uncharacterized protein n=1 Tax=Mikania micrantha TaxID=192012 RepID=A0A5N6LMA1_9ASTR|nr:hypothetical protein E3N88_40286 [Mikania micrantha]